MPPLRGRAVPNRIMADDRFTIGGAPDIKLESVTAVLQCQVKRRERVFRECTAGASATVPEQERTIHGSYCRTKLRSAIESSLVGSPANCGIRAGSASNFRIKMVTRGRSGMHFSGRLDRSVPTYNPFPPRGHGSAAQAFGGVPVCSERFSSAHCSH